MTRPVNDELLEGLTWGFVLVRCTYEDDARWSSFLSILKEINPLSEKLTQTQPWTVIKDKDSLANATMLQACQAFQKWVDTIGAHENDGRNYLATHRRSYFIYVNEESIESIINPVRASEKTGNFLVLVNSREHLKSCKEKETDFRDDLNRDKDFQDVLAEEPDTSWKLFAANEFKNMYLLFSLEHNPWYGDLDCEDFQTAPFVYPACVFGHPHVDHDILYPDKVGYDVYKMLKQFYGPDHLRSMCFEADEAQTGLQRMCGYAGGYRKEEFSYPWYL